MTQESKTSGPHVTYDVTHWPEKVQTWFRERLVSFLIIVGMLASWWIYSNFINTRGNIYFPSISFVIAQTIEYHELVIAGMQTTLTEIVLGYLVALVLGVSIGIVFAESFVIRQMSLPTVVFAYSLPHAIVAPVFILWFGSGKLGIALFVSWFGFFPVLVNTITGFNSVEEEFHHLAAAIETTRWQMIKKIKFWAALPHITSGAKVSLQQSIVGAIIAEFIATGSGLGHIIISANSLNREGLLFGVLIIIMVFAIVLFKVVSVTIDVITPSPES